MKLNDLDTVINLMIECEARDVIWQYESNLPETLKNFFIFSYFYNTRYFKLGYWNMNVLGIIFYHPVFLTITEFETTIWKI